MFKNNKKEQNILNSWIVMEALSPKTYKKETEVAEEIFKISNNQLLPWFNKQPIKKGYDLYYEIYLGNVKMNLASDAILAIFKADEEYDSRIQEKATIATFLVDAQGMLVDDATTVSSFAWSFPLILQKNFDSLKNWTTIESVIKEDLCNVLKNLDDNGNKLPIDYEKIMEAYNFLLNRLRLASKFIEAPSFIARRDHYTKSKTKIESSLLNSFYLDDLIFSLNYAEKGKLNTALRQYLQIQNINITFEKIVDVLTDKNFCEQKLAPSAHPAIRWPIKGKHNLVSLQQLAINTIRSHFADNNNEGLLSINGPPGTGKTTILKDLISGCIFDKVEAMLKLTDPYDAFKATGDKQIFQNNSFINFYQLDSSLKGHEVVIASSNNNAVENISKELPIIDSVEKPISNYFTSLSKNLISDDNSIETWGFISVALGNSSNISKFRNKFWFDDDISIRQFLNKARGKDVGFIEYKDKEGKVCYRLPRIIEEENPYTLEKDTIENWDKVKKYFLDLKTEIIAELSYLEGIRKNVFKIKELNTIVNNTYEKKVFIKQEYEKLKDEFNTIKCEYDRKIKIYSELGQAILLIHKERPSFFNRLFRTYLFRIWKYKLTEFKKDIGAIKKELNNLDIKIAIYKDNLLKKKETINSLNADLEKNKNKLDSLQAEINLLSQKLEITVIDDVFFDDHEKWNLSSPWLPKNLQDKRSKLFDYALQVNKAFINLNAKKIYHNLYLFINAMKKNELSKKEHKRWLSDLWSTLFLITPVISTTFASVNKMFGDLPINSLGWLLIDESGQATPQAPIGLMMRTKRVVVVGDPLQIPPVASLPRSLINEISSYYQVDSDFWQAPKASVQTIADVSSPYQAIFETDFGSRIVGLPLLVHRRCHDPMFHISNKVAYGNKMVKATIGSKDSSIGNILGPSAWVNIKSISQNKWSLKEGNIVIDMLKKLFNEGEINPNLYIISPFKIVAQEMKNLLREVDILDHIWIKDHVGTIHTFQGKEADAVIVILGAPNENQNGSRKWATFEPNIINVMVSRAKKNIYIVGNKSLWIKSGHGKSLDNNDLLLLDPQSIYGYTMISND